MMITAVSVVVADLIGSIETLGLIENKFKTEGSFWEAIGTLNDNFGILGYHHRYFHLELVCFHTDLSHQQV